MGSSQPPHEVRSYPDTIWNMVQQQYSVPVYKTSTYCRKCRGSVVRWDRYESSQRHARLDNSLDVSLT